MENQRLPALAPPLVYYDADQFPDAGDPAFVFEGRTYAVPHETFKKGDGRFLLHGFRYDPEGSTGSVDIMRYKRFEELLRQPNVLIPVPHETVVHDAFSVMYMRVREDGHNLFSVSPYNFQYWTQPRTVTIPHNCYVPADVIRRLRRLRALAC